MTGYLKKIIRSQYAMNMFACITIFAVIIVASTIVYGETKLNKSRVLIGKGKTYQLVLSDTIIGNTSWSTSDDSVVTVSPRGRIKAKNKGKAIISVNSGGVIYKCRVTVKDKNEKCKTHFWDDGVVLRQPTCTNVGKIRYTCLVCNKTRTQKINRTEHSYIESGVIDAQKESQGYTLIRCELCGKEIKTNFTFYQPTEGQAYIDIMSMQTTYPEGMTWNNGNYYGWRAGVFSGGYGCVGFAFIMSDAAFGTLTPARKHQDLSNVRIGDILRINNDSHSVIVLSNNMDSFVVSEGNYNSSIHWGRVIPKYEIINDPSCYVITRYIG